MSGAARLAAMRQFQGCPTVHVFTVMQGVRRDCTECTRKAWVLPNGIVGVSGLKAGDDVSIEPSTEGGWMRVTVTPSGDNGAVTRGGVA